MWNCALVTLEILALYPVSLGFPSSYLVLPVLLIVSFLLKHPPNFVTRRFVVTNVALPFYAEYRMLVMREIGHLWWVCVL